MDYVVLDTNCLVSSLKRDSIYYPIWRDFIVGKYVLCVTDEILDEYEEIIVRKTNSPEIAHNVISAILNRHNTLHVEVFYHFELIKSDLDDNKFVDCAIKANAKYIVTEDHHFNELAKIDFPHIDVIGIDTFLAMLNNNKLV